jgi:hypothetical protein
MVDRQVLVGTRRSLHAVAESVIAGPQYRRAGTIRLALRPGGFGGVALDVGVVGTDLVFAGHRVPIDGATCTTLAGAAGIDAGRPVGLYDDGAEAGVDEVLALDAGACDELVAWYALGEGALRSLGAPALPVLWPEHFDLAVSVGSATCGVSPGDGFSGEPYAYVSVANVPTGDLWNAPFGASLDARRLGGAADLEAFYRQALTEVGEAPGGG